MNEIINNDFSYSQIIRTSAEANAYNCFKEVNTSTNWCAKCSYIDENPKSKLICERHNRFNVIRKKEGNGKHNGIWAGTLTMSPTDPYNEETMVDAIKKIFKQQTCPVKRYKWYIERTKADVPHCHFMYECQSGGRIEIKVIQRYWKIWSEDRFTKPGSHFKGGYHCPVKSEIAYSEYIEKDGGRGQSTWDNMEIQEV